MTRALRGDVLCIIPARAGSRRLPNKNIAPLDGRTLLERAVVTALQAFGEAVVSTDSPHYADIARAAGAHVPGLRPAELSTDDAPIDDVIHHLVATLDTPAQTVVLMQVTTPFTVSADLEAVVAALVARPDAGCSLTATRVPAAYASILVDRGGLYTFADAGLAARRTQDVPTIALPTGGAYAARIARLRAGEPLLQSPFAVVEVDPARAVDIDDAADLARAERLASGCA
ncbi:MAG TPA: acylneuraminate cytidylyltransferase family protein [Candidatus Dormibacteraeota bacterium]|nr:acylneuraminate cytidylyltransferase family protein [Candidatus Dormibacteraeota bacterium]